jgi:hypothetical protein
MADAPNIRSPTVQSCPKWILLSVILMEDGAVPSDLAGFLSLQRIGHSF